MEPQQQVDTPVAIPEPDFGELSKKLDGEALPAAGTDPTPQAPATPVATTAAAAAATPAAVTDAKVEDATGGAKVDDDNKVTGIATPDGKTIIPYRELQETRVKLADSRTAIDTLTQQNLQLAEQLRQQTTQLEARSRQAPSDLAAGKAADIAAAGAETGDMAGAIDAGLAEVDAETPYLGVALRKALAPLIAAAGNAAKLQTELDTIRQERNAFFAQQDATKAQTVSEAIDNVPIVSHWKANGAVGQPAHEAWEEAKRIDDRLKLDPKWKDQPMVARFEEAQRRVIAMLGPEIVPESLQGFVKAPPAARNEKVIEQGKEALKNATTALGSLSDIPGGTPAAASTADQLGKGTLGVRQLESMFFGKPEAAVLGVFGNPNI